MPLKKGKSKKVTSEEMDSSYNQTIDLTTFTAPKSRYYQINNKLIFLEKGQSIELKTGDNNAAQER